MVSRKRKSRSKSARRFIKKGYLEIGKCRGKKQDVCYSDPNCSYRKYTGCVRKRGKAKSRKLFFGPVKQN